MAVIEIEVDHPRNRNLQFTPIQAVVRGRLDFLRGDKALREKADDFPTGIPGQVIGFDTDAATGYVAEPLHDAEHAALRRQIEGSGQSLPERRRTFPGPGEAHYDHASTWLFWMKRAVESGHARVVKGKLPAEVRGPVRKNFVTADPARRRTEADLLAWMMASATPEQRAEYDRRKAELAGAR
jgi:hypothetical protein